MSKPIDVTIGVAWRNEHAVRKASLFKNGGNQAVRLPQELRFPDGVNEVLIRKEGNSLILSPAKPDWPSFFASTMEMSDDFMANRDDQPPQRRESL